MDTAPRCVDISSGAHVDYDLLSLDVDSETDLCWLGAAGPRLLPLRPMGAFVMRWPEILEAVAGADEFHVIVVGGGAAGVEIACAVQQVFESRRFAAIVSLVTSARGLLPGVAEGARRRVAQALHSRGIPIFMGPAVGHETGALLGSGRNLSADCVVAATGARAPYWLARSGRRPSRYRPRRRSLYLLSTGPRQAIAIRGSFSGTASAYWHLKGWIDRRFVARNTLMESRDDPVRRQSLRERARQLLTAAASPGIARTALRVSAVVGTVLNIINQGDALLGRAPLDWLHLALNYLVPFCVASYSGACNELTGGGHHGER